jgi:hypothetical protein
VGKVCGVRRFGVASSFLYTSFTVVQVKRSLNFHQVGVPYVRAKAQDYFEELGGGVTADILDSEVDGRQIRETTDQVLNLNFLLGIPNKTFYRASRKFYVEGLKLSTRGLMPGLKDGCCSGTLHISLINVQFIGRGYSG